MNPIISTKLTPAVERDLSNTRLQISLFSEFCVNRRLLSNWTRFLSLTFRDPERFLARVSPAKRKLSSLNESIGWGHWAFSFAGVPRN